jgi:putative mRNA 3-end processing factor
MTRRLGTLDEPLPVTYRRPFELGPLTIELFPAGHVLGSAQIRVTRDGKRVVYTGDLNGPGSLTAEPMEVAECDVLIIESTFGHPRYRFPSRQDGLEMVRGFVERCRAQGEIPVLLAYALGKAQEVVSYLGNAGFKLAVHATIHATCDVYRQNGIDLPEVRSFRGTLEEDEVLLLPPSGGRSSLKKLSKPVRTAMLTGWALGGSGTSRGADEMIPLSDHADFPTLVDYVLSTGAKRIFTVHGFCEELAEALRERGKDARPLLEPPQLELF